MTRYPRAGKGNRWTVRELDSIPAEWKGDTLSDGGGLSGEVRILRDGTASVRFKYAFAWEGKVLWHQCGTYPNKNIAEIRAERDRARQQVAEGINPTDAKKAAKIEHQAAIESTLAEAARQRDEDLTVADLFEQWLKDGVSREDGNAELRRSFSKDVLPVVGTQPLRSLTERHLLDMLRKVRERGLNRTVVSLSSDFGQMLRWAEKRKPWRALLIDGNPADLVDVTQLLDPDYEEERDRVLSADEIKELYDRFTQLEQDYAKLPAGKKYGGIRPVSARVQCAVWLCLSTLCRIGELLKAEWRHVDLQAGTWWIPAANTKGLRGKRQDHHIFLSPFAVRQFERLRTETGHTPWCFPAKNTGKHVCLKSVSKQIGDRQCRFKDRSKPLSRRRHDDTLVLADAVNGEWTPHDMRRTGATLMQGLGVPLETIDRCQNHVLPGPKVRRHYMHHRYAKEKTAAWGALGEQLEMILSTKDVIVAYPDAVNTKLKLVA